MKIKDFKPGICYYSIHTDRRQPDKVDQIDEFIGIYMCLSNENGIITWLNSEVVGGCLIDMSNLSDIDDEFSLNHIKPL